MTFFFFGLMSKNWNFHGCSVCLRSLCSSAKLVQKPTSPFECQDCHRLHSKHWQSQKKKKKKKNMITDKHCTNSKIQRLISLCLSSPNKPSSSGCVVSSVARFLAVRFCVLQTLAFSIACRDSQTVTCSHYSMRTLPHTFSTSHLHRTLPLSLFQTQRQREREREGEASSPSH